jgi:hypothetical protein
VAKEGQPTAEDIEAQKKWREGTAAEGFDMVETLAYQIYGRKTPLHGEQDFIITVYYRNHAS